MMEDKDFYAEIVKRISPPLKRKTDQQLVKIVLQNTYIEIEDMFDDKGVNELFDRKDATLLGDVYRFIRDNQNLYVNPQYMDIKKIDNILNDENVLDILNSQQFCYEDSQALLNNAIYRINFPAIKMLMEKNIMPSLDTAFFIENLATKSQYLKILEYIESKGVDLLKLGSGRLLLTATLNKNHHCVDFLSRKMPLDSYIVKKSLEKYVAQEYDSKLMTRQTKENFLEIAHNMIPIMHSLMNKLSSKAMDGILSKLITQEMKDFLNNQYLVVSLQQELSQKNVISSKVKI